MAIWVNGVDITQPPFNFKAEPAGWTLGDLYRSLDTSVDIDGTPTDENPPVEDDKYPTEMDGPVDAGVLPVDSGIFPVVSGYNSLGLPVGPGGFPVVSGWSGESLDELFERFGRDVYEGEIL